MGYRAARVLQVLAILNNVAVLGYVAGPMPRSGSPTRGGGKVSVRGIPNVAETR